MMQSVVQYGTGQAAQGPYMAAGKTGTSQDFRDAWFIGFTQQYAGAVWVGNDDNSPMKRVTGGMIPAAVWRDMMTTATSKPAKTYFAVTGVENDFSFQDLLGRLIGDGTEQTSPLSDQPVNNAPAKPLDNKEYKWQFND